MNWLIQQLPYRGGANGDDAASTGVDLRLLEEIHLSLERLNSSISAVEKRLSALSGDVSSIKWSGEFLRLASTQAVIDEVYEFYREHQLSMLDTLDRLVTTESSLARFGDGELRTMLKPEYNLDFQHNSPGLMQDLIDVMSKPVNGLLIGLPHCYRDRFWTALWMEVWRPLRCYIPSYAMYANSHVTRPLAFQFLGQDAVERWREVWRGKEIQVITGKGSRFDAVPALFDSAKAISRVDSVPVNAYLDLPRLLSSNLLGHPDLFVIALGPAGTILASELHQRGQRALDVGHISSSYQQVFEGGRVPERLPMIRS